VNAAAREIPIDTRPARTVLANFRAYLAEIAAKIEKPTALLRHVEGIVSEANAAQATVDALANQLREIEVRRLLGSPVDVGDVRSLEKQLKEAERVSAEAEHRAVPARIATDQLRGDIDALNRSLAAERNRAPLLMVAALAEEFNARCEAVNPELAAFAKRYAWLLSPCAAIDILSIRHPDLKIPLRTFFLKQTITLPVPEGMAGIDAPVVLRLDPHVDTDATALIAELGSGGR
jgi:hypothetical protein